jgi:hypothetical protein
MIKRRVPAYEITQGRSGSLVSRASRSWKMLAALSVTVPLAATALIAPTASASEVAGTAVTPGGMVRAGSTAARLEAPAASNPSCSSVTFRGTSGYISVQESNGRLQWGITMTPLSLSIGTWSVSTYLSGQQTTSGFNRTVTTPYIPHGSLSVPSGKVFTVSALVNGPNGIYQNAPNACTT